MSHRRDSTSMLFLWAQNSIRRRRIGHTSPRELCQRLRALFFERKKRRLITQGINLVSNNRLDWVRLGFLQTITHSKIYQMLSKREGDDLFTRINLSLAVKNEDQFMSAFFLEIISCFARKDSQITSTKAKNDN